MAKAGSKKRKIIICIVSIVAVIALLFGACAVYLGDYYHAITPAGESFGLQDGSSLTETIKLDNGNIVCKSENATKGLIFYPGGKVDTLHICRSWSRSPKRAYFVCSSGCHQPMDIL